VPPSLYASVAAAAPAAAPAAAMTGVAAVDPDRFVFVASVRSRAGPSLVLIVPRFDSFGLSGLRSSVLLMRVWSGMAGLALNSVTVPCDCIGGGDSALVNPDTCFMA